MTEAKPKVVELPAFKVVGLEMVCQLETAKDIPTLWELFCPLMDKLPPHEGIYGVCLPVESDPKSFRYLACARVADTAPVPDGMVAAQVPAATYAVYPFKDKVAEMPNAFGDIYQRLIPAAGLSLADGGMPCLEYYPPDCMDEATGKITADLMVAVKAPAKSRSRCKPKAQ